MDNGSNQEMARENFTLDVDSFFSENMYGGETSTNGTVGHLQDYFNSEYEDIFFIPETDLLLQAVKGIVLNDISMSKFPIDPTINKKSSDRLQQNINTIPNTYHNENISQPLELPGPSSLLVDNENHFQNSVPCIGKIQEIYFIPDTSTQYTYYGNDGQPLYLQGSWNLNSNAFSQPMPQQEIFYNPNDSTQVTYGIDGQPLDLQESWNQNPNAFTQQIKPEPLQDLPDFFKNFNPYKNSSFENYQITHNNIYPIASQQEQQLEYQPEANNTNVENVDEITSVPLIIPQEEINFSNVDQTAFHQHENEVEIVEMEDDPDDDCPQVESVVAIQENPKPTRSFKSFLKRLREQIPSNVNDENLAKRQKLTHNKENVTPTIHQMSSSVCMEIPPNLSENQSENQPENQPGNQPENQPENQPGNQPENQPENEQENQTIRKDNIPEDNVIMVSCGEQHLMTLGPGPDGIIIRVDGEDQNLDEDSANISPEGQASNTIETGNSGSLIGQEVSHDSGPGTSIASNQMVSVNGMKVLTDELINTFGLTAIQAEQIGRQIKNNSVGVNIMPYECSGPMRPERCDICKVTCYNQEVLDQHLFNRHRIIMKRYNGRIFKLWETKDNRFVCTDCNRFFELRQLLEHQMNDHHTVHLMCTECFYRTDDIDQYLKHYKENITHIMKWYFCRLCGMKSCHPVHPHAPETRETDQNRPYEFEEYSYFRQSSRKKKCQEEANKYNIHIVENGVVTRFRHIPIASINMESETS